MLGDLSESALNPTRNNHSAPLEGTGEFAIEDFKTTRDMAEAICCSLKDHSAYSLASNLGLWAWLTFVLADVLFSRTNGVRNVGDIHRWYPAPPNNYQKAQRHLVRMPVLLHSSLGADADHLICGKPGIGSDIREQLTSQQDMFSVHFQRACKELYFDEKTGLVKRGVGGKSGPGVPRRLAQVRKQLDVTWDMTDLPSEKILSLLPNEFDRWKSGTTESS